VSAFRFGTNLAQHLRHLLMDAFVGRQNLRAGNIERTSIHIGDLAAGFLNQQRSRGHIPWLEAEFPKSIEPAARDGSEVERGGTRAPHSLDARHHFFPEA